MRPSLSTESFSSLLSRKIEQEPRDRQDHAAGGLDADALHVDANPDLQVGTHEDAFVVMHLQLQVLQDWLGAAGGGHAGGGLEGVEQLLTLA